MNRFVAVCNELSCKVRDYSKDIRYRWTFFTVCIFGFFSYIYLLTNNIHNYDSLAWADYGVGMTLTSGRWSLYFLSLLQNSFAGDIWFNSPVVNTSLALLFLAMICMLLVSVLELKSKWACAVITAVTITCPAIANTMVFNFTAHLYCFSIFCGTLAVWLAKKNKLICNILSIFLLAVCIGGYQAYMCYCAMLLMLVLIMRCMQADYDWKCILKFSLKFLLILMLGYCAYMGILKGCLHHYEMNLTTYQGIDKIGQLDVRAFPETLKKIYINVFALFEVDYCKIAVTGLVKKCIVVLNICVLIMSVLYLLKNNCGVLKKIEFCVFLALLPIAMDAIEIMVPDGWIYTIMVFGMIGIFYLPIMMANEMVSEKVSIRKLFTGIVMCVIFLVSINYCYILNVNYTSLHYYLEVTENYYTILYSRIISTEDYSTDKEIVFVGSDFQNCPRPAYNIGDLAYTSFNVNVWSKVQVTNLYVGDTFREISEDEKSKYHSLIDNMSVYPNENSITAVDDVVLVKICE